MFYDKAYVLANSIAGVHRRKRLHEELEGTEDKVVRL